jgi:hypothetical protein
MLIRPVFQLPALEIILFVDDQLTAVMRAALQLPVEKRNRLLQRIADRLELPDGVLGLPPAA